jgi:drug/metabolite transporter (DMT)-like permease
MLVQTLAAAGTHLAAKRATASFDPFVLVTLRLALAALAFAPVLALTPGPKLPPRSTWRWLALFSLLAGPVNQGLFMVGLSRSKAMHGGLLYALTPIGVYTVALALGRERSSPRRLAGILLALAGVVALLLERGLAAAMGPLFGDLLILGAVAAWVAWTTGSRTFAAEHGGLRTAGWSIIGGGLWALPAVPFALARPGLGEVDAVGWGCLLYLVLVASILSYTLWNYALARVEASRVAIFTNLQPVATALAAWALLGEPLTWGVFASGALVLTGVRLAQRG